MFIVGFMDQADQVQLDTAIMMASPRSDEQRSKDFLEILGFNVFDSND